MGYSHLQGMDHYTLEQEQKTPSGTIHRDRQDEFRVG